MEIKLTSEIAVEEIQAVGSDGMIAAAAQVSVKGLRSAADMDRQTCGIHTPDMTEAVAGCPFCAEQKKKYDKMAGLIRYLMSSRHGTPFEHGCLTVRVHAPIKVWREWHRHRVGWSYNEESGRYKQLEPVFYVPPRHRPLIRPEGFKSSRPAFDTATDDEYQQVLLHLEAGYRAAYLHYQAMLEMQVDRGLARDVLGVGVYSACYCTANPRSILHFLELRTNRPDAKRPSKPLAEIEMAANKLEAIFAKRWPVTHAAWQECGRAAP